MKNLTSYIIAGALGLTLLGCKKDKETPAPSKTELLTSKDWVISAQTVSPGLPNPNGGTITDLYAQLAPCDKDDFIRFDTPGAFKEDEGAAKCNSSSTQTRTGTWVFGNNETVVTIAGTNVESAGSYNLVDLSASTMKLTVTQALNGVNYTVTTTFTKK